MKRENSDSTYVLTTKRVIREGRTVILVSHDDNGDWQYLDAANCPSEMDAMLGSFEEMIQHDPSAHPIADLPVGRFATRKDKESEWQIDPVA